MTSRKSQKPASPRGEQVRQRILDAAERLLRQGNAEFSMRDLAAEASVSFATPFNQFGSKLAIMHALSGRRIDSMEALLSSGCPAGDAIDRVFFATDAAASVMVLEPVVNRAVMGSLGAPSSTPGTVLERSAKLWATALDRGDGLSGAHRAEALDILPKQLAFGFRGVLSFWTAGELNDADLAPAAKRVAATLMLGFADPRRRAALIQAAIPHAK
ncbi:TetR/AcrR family transcriptional regulator [Hyphomicrobium sp. DY-1]|uniref:TetR/AcrR family transcriptional regulator n=1 Tax=Hyphomicrobium sp. DY-1 TaxID=3075650 RepID=UPI0039C36F33